jgi:hypothetical protein
MEASSWVESDPVSSEFAHGGQVSHRILLQPGGYAGTVSYVFQDTVGISLVGYTHLDFYINGGEHSGQDPKVAGRKLSSWGIVPQANTWTKVSIPISDIPPTFLSDGRLRSLSISESVTEPFYIDDMRLVARHGSQDTTGIEASDGTGLPLDYALSQNYPNPFNAVTTITYDLPKACDVTLTIYVLTGQEVGTLVSGYQEAGHYEVTWKGKGQASGIYLYRLEAGEFVETRRMVLLR